MDAVKYSKGEYTKMALKGIAIPFEHEWERALVAFSCIANVNASFITTLLKLENQVPEDFMASFEKGTPMDALKHINDIRIMMRLRRGMNLLASYVTEQLRKLEPVINPHEKEADKAIMAYYKGNHAVLLKEAENYTSIARNITTSLTSCFPNSDLASYEKETFANIHTEEDMRAVNEKFATALHLEKVLKW